MQRCEINKQRAGGVPAASSRAPRAARRLRLLARRLTATSTTIQFSGQPSRGHISADLMDPRMASEATYRSAAHEAMLPYGVDEELLKTYRPPAADDTPVVYVANEVPKRTGPRTLTAASLAAALQEAQDVQRQANEAYAAKYAIKGDAEE